MSNEANRADEQSLIVNQLIAEFMSRTDAGENLDVAQFLKEHSEHAAELEKHFANVDLLDGLKETGQQGHDETILKSDADSERSTDDATANTIVRGGTDSETSVTRDFERRDTEKTEVAIPENFGRYAIQKVLGQGAMGAVYLARDTQLDRDVALKIPKFDDSNGVDDEELLARFYREARASATLRSPNICPVYDVGEIDGQHYITMAYIEGRPLKDFTKSKKQHSEKQIATTIRKLAQGLEEAHEIGVIHRDLKPANIMVDLKGEPVVMDFGLARRSSSDDVQVTQSGAILGTPAYMAPEQVAGDQAAINHQVDIYALGVIMYELITGEMPFKGNLMAILQQIALNNPTKPSEIRDNLDPRLEKICLKMMAGDQKKRYQSMNDVAADLQDVIKHPNRKQKKEAAQKTGPKPKAIPTAYEESNPALISVEQPKSYAEQLRKKKSKPSSKSAKSSTRLPVTSPTDSGGNKQKLLIAGGLGGLILLLGIIFLVRVGKYDVQITLDDPSITLSVDGEVLNIKDGQDIYQLSAGEHKLQLQKDGLKTHVEEFTVTKDGKTALRATVVNGKLDALHNGEKIPQIAASSPSETLQPTKAAWHGWSSDAPPPAIAPFDAEQAKIHQQEWADYLAIPVEYTNSIGMKFRLIPPGEFMMGSTPEEIEATLKVAGKDEVWKEWINSEAPQHKVILTHPVYIGVTEVTQMQYEQVMGSNPSHFSTTGEGNALVVNLNTGNHPVEMMSWHDAVEFCAKLSQQEQQEPFYFRSDETTTPLNGTGYRLPTEAEWESACRAGTTTRFWFGDWDQDVNTVAWIGVNSGERTHAGGELRANPFGLSDMHGNVWEWVLDKADPAFYRKFKENAAINPVGLTHSGSFRVFRGGNWFSIPPRCRSSNRIGLNPARSLPHLGFRVVLPVEAVKEALKEEPKSVTHLGWPADAPTPPAIAPFDAAAAKPAESDGLRWPLESSRPEDIAWLQDLGATITLRTGLDQNIDLTPDDKLPAAQATIVGVKFDPDEPQRVTDEVMRRLGTLTDLEKLELKFTNRSTPVTAAGPSHLAALVHLRHLELAHFVRHPNIDPSFFAALPRLEYLNISYSSRYWWEEGVVRSKSLRHLFLYEALPENWEPFARMPRLREVTLMGRGGTGDRGEREKERHVAARQFATLAPWCRVVARGFDEDKATWTIIEPTVPNPYAKQAGSSETSGTSERPSPAVAPFDEARAKANQQAWADYLELPVEKQVELPGGAKTTFILIPPGEFLMGTNDSDREQFIADAKADGDKFAFEVRIPNEGPQHRVKISHPFYLGKFEVTQGEWQSVIGSNPSKFGGNRSRPVETVSWLDVEAFVEKLNKDADSVSLFSLPTEAEWEYACRAGTTTPFHFDGAAPELVEFGWFDRNSNESTHPVGLKKPNPWGLYDMHGNVREWCDDWFSANYYVSSPEVDPLGPEQGEKRVDRGGVWRNNARFSRSAERGFAPPDDRGEHRGFRLKMSIDMLPLE